jgi:hypothetical protein
MSISQQVKESLDEAEKHLRNALAFAARSEEPWVVKHITSCVLSIEEIYNVDEITEHLDELRKTFKGPDE